MTSYYRRIVILSLLICGAVFGEQNYADLSFQCPLRTTCPVACVADAKSCPNSLSCGNGLKLCADGSCIATDATCNPSLVSPCSALCSSTPFTCAKTIDYYGSCFDKYDSFYNLTTQCVKQETTEKKQLLTFNEPGFKFCYWWFPIVITISLLWCAYNQRFYPVDGSIKHLREAEELTTDDAQDYSTTWTQTAYCGSFVGSFIYFLVCLSLFGIQVLLAVLTIFYYLHDGQVSPQEEEQVLRAFIITWMLGFIWSFALKWPFSIHSLFLRRCLHGQASYVAVYAPTESTDAKQETQANTNNSRYVSQIKCCLNSLKATFNCIMAFIFSDVTRPQDLGQITYCKVYQESGCRFFYFRLRRYNYDPSKDEFAPGYWSLGNSISQFLDAKDGLQAFEVEERKLAIGSNSIRMKKPHPLRSIIEEFSTSYYTYQNFIIWSWFPLQYYYMAFLYTFVVAAGGLSVAFFKYKTEMTLYKLTHVSGDVEAYRDSQYVTIPQQDIVPGDVVVLKPGVTYCDMVVLYDTHLVVDESALTGESTPVSKSAIDLADRNSLYKLTSHKKHTIFAGTCIIENSETETDLALVIKTGSFTSKGEMLREILAYERHHFKFDTEVQIVIIILFFYALIGFVIVMNLIKMSNVYGWFYGMYVFAAALPPLLPTVFVVSVGISDECLSRKNIACSNSESILVAGKVRKALFDKTGTLTKQGLDFLSARSCTEWNNQVEDKIPSGNTLTQSSDGSIIGNTVDKIMFEASGASLKSRNNNIVVQERSGRIVTVVKRYEFDHQRMAQSVIVKFPEGRTVAFVKGSAESIRRICRPESLPENYDEVVKQCSSEGIYQLSMAFKELQKSKFRDFPRENVERDLSFVGVLNFKNMLRDETPQMIQQLKEGDVDSIMVTGDSLLTGIHIAKECGMIRPDQKVVLGQNIAGSKIVAWMDDSDRFVELPPLEELKRHPDIALCVSGAVWSTILENNRDEALQLVEHIRVYGRCTPNDKVSVVSALIDKGYITSMCGDGGNDCGALKTAHVGIALSDAEASIVSPFTSLDKSITSIVDVLKEGRCALASAFASYKYMIMYGQIQTINQITCAYFQITFAEWCWIFMDGFWVLSMAFSLPLAKAAKILAPERPTSSLLGAYTMSSVLGVLLLNVSFTTLAMSALYHQEWYQCRKYDGTDVSNVLVIGDNYEATVLFLVVGYQFISSAMTYNFGYNFREGWFQNRLFVLLVCIFTIIHFYVTLVPGSLSCMFRVNCSNDNVVRTITSSTPKPINNFFNSTIMPVSFRWELVFIMILNAIVIMSYDYFIVNGIGKKYGRRWKKHRQQQKSENIQDFASVGTEIELTETEII